MKFNIMDYVQVEERDDPDITWFQVDPAQIYPAMIDHIAEAVEVDRAVGPHLATHFNNAKALPSEAWKLALVPKGQLTKEQQKISSESVRDLVAGDDTVSSLATSGEQLRAMALEIARRWFTAMLHAAIGNAPMGLHILKNENWRL